MPDYTSSTAAPPSIACDVMFVPVFGKDDGMADVGWLDAATNSEISRARKSGEFEARPFEVFATPATGSAGARRIALVGAGETADASPERLRRLGAACGYAASRFRAASAAFLIREPLDAVTAAQHVTDGFVTTEFDGGSYRTDPSLSRAPVGRVTMAAPGGDGTTVSAAVARGRIIGEAANFTRALANEPANVLTPAELAARVVEACDAAGLKTEVLDEHRLADLGMGLLLGVGQGSANPPRLVVIWHEPAAEKPFPNVVGLVGKGVTFDTGGVSIKPADGMERMKSDMSGAAAVAGAMLALARLECPYRVIGIIPAAENMVGGRSIRPGDVLRGASGKTVEVINTDAEGRLILGDALWYAQQLGCTHLVDVATLTGACSIALGKYVSGLLGQPRRWTASVQQHATRAGERLWELPIYEEALEQLRSEIADMVNSAGRPGGVITAAAFLREFAGSIPWAHLDIAGTAWAETKEPYQPKGATGVAVRTLIEVARSGAGPETTS